MTQIHPIAYPCGCVFAFMVDKRGWLLIDASGEPKGQQSKLCEAHTAELRKLGFWK